MNYYVPISTFIFVFFGFVITRKDILNLTIKLIMIIMAFYGIFLTLLQFGYIVKGF